MSLSPQQIAEKGEALYKEKYQAELEKSHLGQYVAIDVESGACFVGESPENVLTKAQESRQGGLFHLMKIGSAGVYHVSSFFAD